MTRLPACPSVSQPALFSVRVAASGLLLAALLAGSTLPANAAGDLEAGRKKVRMCQVCHGLDGIGTNPTVPNLAGESAVYLTKQLKAFRSGERKHEQMSIIAKGLSDEDIDNVAAYYSAIKITATPPPAK